MGRDYLGGGATFLMGVLIETVNQKSSHGVIMIIYIRQKSFSRMKINSCTCAVTDVFVNTIKVSVGKRWLYVALLLQSL